MKAKILRVFLVTTVLLCGQISGLSAQSVPPFEGGWALDVKSSELTFMSIKKQVVAETSSFASFTGKINDTGDAEIRVFLDSVDTKIDLRNVRMRFLFFESFQFPEAVITTQLTTSLLSDLAQKRQIEIALPFEFSIRDVTVSRVANVSVSLLNNDRVVVTSVNPLAFTTEELNLEAGRLKLQETQSVDIVPVGIVSFNFVFDRSGTAMTSVNQLPSLQLASVALETKGKMSFEACQGRFEILTQTGNIFFAPGSSRLDGKSLPLLENLRDIISRCPGFTIEISGHTDSIGTNEENQVISEQRASSVADWLLLNGIPANRISSVGYGETRPFVDNSTKENRARNRRIEFLAVAN